MTSQNNLARWTQPTTDKEKRFFSQNSGAISRNSMVLWLIQAIWIMFSHGPATHLLQSKLAAFPAVQEFAWLFALGILAFLHYVLHDEILETISNIVDGVKETVNGLMNWLVPAGIIIALVLLDALGIANNFRDNTFESQRLTNTSAAKTELAQAVTDYQQSLKNIESTRKDDSLAAIAPFNLAINKAQKIKTYDQYDVNSKNGKIATLKSERSLAVAEVRKSASSAIKEAQSTYLAEKQRITGKRDSTDTTLITADKENEASSWGYGWTISVFILLIFVAIAYKLVVLRVESGIRKNVAFTELDAQGGFFEKLAVAFSDITKRQGHRFLVWFHKIGSMGTATLHDFDGKIILRESSYNTPDDILKTPKGGNNGGGSQGGFGGSGSIPPHLPPAPGQPLGGQSAHGSTKKQWQKPAISTAPTTTTEIAQSFWNDLTPDTKLDIVNKLKSQTGLPIRELYIACEKHNPQIPFFETVVTEVNEWFRPNYSTPSVSQDFTQHKVYVRLTGLYSKGKTLLSFHIYNYNSKGEFLFSSEFKKCNDQLDGEWLNTQNSSDEPKHLIVSYRHEFQELDEAIQEQVFEAITFTKLNHKIANYTRVPFEYMDIQFTFDAFPTPSVQSIDFDLTQDDIQAETSVQTETSVQNDKSSVQTEYKNGLIIKQGIAYVPYTMKKGERKGETVEMDLPQVKSRARQYFREENATSFKEFFELFKLFGKQDSELGLPQIGIDRMLLQADKEGRES